MKHDLPNRYKLYFECACCTLRFAMLVSLVNHFLFKHAATRKEG